MTYKLPDNPSHFSTQGKPTALEHFLYCCCPPHRGRGQFRELFEAAINEILDEDRASRHVSSDELADAREEGRSAALRNEPPHPPTYKSVAWRNAFIEAYEEERQRFSSPQNVRPSSQENTLKDWADIIIK